MSSDPHPDLARADGARVLIEIVEAHLRHLILSHTGQPGDALSRGRVTAALQEVRGWQDDVRVRLAALGGGPTG